MTEYGHAQRGRFRAVIVRAKFRRENRPFDNRRTIATAVRQNELKVKVAGLVPEPR